jgi:type IV pilus assembly protein PilY1
VLTYNGFDTNNDNSIDTFLDKVIYGTNDGALHMVNGDTGAEEWRFMPSDFWGQQQSIFANGEGNHLYGLDVTPTVQIIDTNGDGIIKPSDSDKVRAFVSSRRGNSNIYALDLSGDILLTDTNKTVVPRFMWRIEGGVGDFTRLGQTWSQPTIVTIAINTGTTIENREVLIFGGGYDTALDNPATYSPSDNGGNDFMGNAIYIVDPEDGSLLLSISGSGSGADIQVADMHYSIPSAVRSLDSDSDGVDDRLYVGDVGGQVWRVDLAPLEINSGYSAAGTSAVGKLAKISADSVPAKRRRFFEAPSVTQVRDSEFSNESNYDYVLMGTGYRPHPLNREVEDRFYAFRDFQTGANEMANLDITGNGDNIINSGEGYPQLSGNAFTDADLVNVTTTVLDGGDSTHRTAAGWFYDFTQAGTVAEKVLSTAVTTGGVVTFTTFSPEAASSTDPCGASLGLGTAYNFDILSAGAALDFDGDGSITPADRTFELTSGIPSGVVPVFTTEGVIGIVGVEGGSKQLGKLADLPNERGYWFEESEF